MLPLSNKKRYCRHDLYSDQITPGFSIGCQVVVLLLFLSFSATFYSFNHSFQLYWISHQIYRTGFPLYVYQWSRLSGFSGLCLWGTKRNEMPDHHDERFSGVEISFQANNWLAVLVVSLLNYGKLPNGKKITQLAGSWGKGVSCGEQGFHRYNEPQTKNP